MGLLDPVQPPYDPLEWAKQPLVERSRSVCQSWALQGYGTPPLVYLAYALKLGGFVGGWWAFCSFSAEPAAGPGSSAWWLQPLAFQKAILWSLLFEVLGFGCGSGPLTGRYWPPLGGFLYFFRRGTTKLPLVRGVAIIGRQTRGSLDVALYALLVVAVLNALVAASLDASVLIPIVVLVPVCGVLDRTLFLAARAEHHWVMIVVFACTPNWFAGTQAVQAALWFWAGVSKLNHHFPAVVGVMISNSPVTRIEAMRRAMYRTYPDDLRPSRLAGVMAHAGTSLELAVPILLLAGDGGSITALGLVLMVILHGFILASVPMGVPLEWNIVVVYGGYFLFGHHADVSVFDLANTPWVAAFVGVFAVGLPLAGNLFPRHVSFLLAMRYYAGNWPYSLYLFRRQSYRKLDTLRKSSPWIYDQLDRFYDRRTAIGLASKVMAFRLMHLAGRALCRLVPRAIGNSLEYEWIDGELVAGMVLGWNFGDGHLHREDLLESVQAQCEFEPGELICIFVESQPLFRTTLAWRIRDAAAGELERGTLELDELRRLQPWEFAAPEIPTTAEPTHAHDSPNHSGQA